MRAARLQPAVPWFLDMNMAEASFDATTFTHNRARLLEHDSRANFFPAWSRRPGMQLLRRALHGGRHADRGLGVAKELQAQGREPSQPPDDPGNPTVNSTARSAATRLTSRRRTRGEAGEKGQGQGSEAVVLGQRADGKSERSAGRVRGRTSRRQRRAQKCPNMLETACRSPDDYTGCRQGLRH